MGTAELRRTLHLHLQKDDTQPRTAGTLRRWRSLEGDWRTFLCPTEQIEISSNERRSHNSASGSLVRLGRDDRSILPDYDRPQNCARYKGGGSETDWCEETLTFPFEDDRSCSSAVSKHSGMIEFSPGFQESFHSLDRDELQRVVTSSYPLLEENLSLLQKLKKERDVCRQLENDMRDLEGQIQDVSKSFHTTSELDSTEESCGNSEGGYISDENADSITVDGSYEQVMEPEIIQNRLHHPWETGGLLEEGLDPVTVIEATLSSLMDLAERLELAVRERDLEISRLFQASSLQRISTEWTRPCQELSRIPSELVDLLQDLQIALRLLLASKAECDRSRNQGDRECSSPASFTFESFGDGKVLVPTVRTIFSPVGDSVEMRPVQEQIEETYASTNSLFQSSETKEDQEPTESDPEVSPEVAVDYHLPEKEPPDQKDLPVPQELVQDRPQSTFDLELQPSADIIKRIERLQELVKPELRESLKQRALKIQKAKEDFLSGVVGPPSKDVPQEEEEHSADILIEDVSEPSPTGLSVKEQTEDKKVKLHFLRKKKHQSWGSEELCRESLVLEDKPDWLRNPFRPKGKYKISK